MGFFHQGVPDYLVSWGQSMLLGAHAVETGTYLGDSAILLAEAFGVCTTIEKDPRLAQRAQDRFFGDARVKVLQGSSREHLPTVLAKLESPPFVWLDAHWSGGVTAGSDDPCPVLAEIDSVTSAFGDESFIAIDDARIFGASDPRDEINSNWPSLFELLSHIESRGLASLVVDDVVIGVSPKLRDSVASLVPQSWMGRNRTLQIYEMKRNDDRLASARHARTLRSRVKSGLAKARRLGEARGSETPGR